MLKTLPLLVGLLVGAAGCKDKSSPAPAQTGPAATDQTAGSGGAPGARMRNGKVDWKPMRRDASGQWMRPDKGGPIDESDDDEAVARAERRADRMAKVDTNADGTISDEERLAAQKARAAENLARLDTDGDGQVSEPERAAAQLARATKLSTRLDTDANGKVTVEELRASRFGRLDPDELDKNKDGEISNEELAAGLPQRARFGGPRGPGGPGDPPPGEPATPTKP